MYKGDAEDETEEEEEEEEALGAAGIVKGRSCMRMSGSGVGVAAYEKAQPLLHFALLLEVVRQRPQAAARCCLFVHSIAHRLAPSKW